ncbi:hypothetical protein Rhe02_00780 [Rhizocola hellebori]|uniref:M4 family peptidase n=1 Tax=Rhizocola hellebori TaxID=1392758 RepID=A0A8J3Q1R0_9ACTN|nr:M4 family metallopeptidase [Rhizocola hellebori]GIH02011.1 hypothetical protein Rhe02_00780 [Rhizocola hellebori]
MFRSRPLFAAAALLTAVGTATLTMAGPAAAQPAPTPAASPTVQEAMDHATQDLSAQRAALRAAPGDAFTARTAVVDADGTSHVRVERTYHGLKVRGGEAILHYRPGGGFKAVTNALDSQLSLAVTPALDAAKATSIAAGAFPDVVRKAGFSATELFVDAAAQPTLAWDVAIPIPGGILHVFVDALTGAVRGSDTGLRTIAAGGGQARPAKTEGLVHPNAPEPPGGGTTPPCCEQGSTGTGAGYHTGKVALASAYQLNSVVVPITYYLKDRTRGGHLTRDALDATNNENTGTVTFTDSDNYWSTGAMSNRASAAVDAHYGAAVTWDFYKNVLGRNGIKNNGVGARSFVHYIFYDPSYGYFTDNAGWNDDCFCMMYGDGGGPGNLPLVTAIDVAGHEMSHGVTSETANLNYNLSEAGGLNESTSDIFGTLVEFHANNAADAADYKIGEKITGAATPLRWMDDPDQDGVSKSCWYNGVGGVDPHYSSGVGNHFFYTLAVGSGMSAWGNSPTCGGAPAVTGIGNEKAGRIWYQALSAYMVSNETYAKARVSTINAANDLYGGVECEAVKAAWAAVAVPVQASEAACAPAQTLPLLTNPGNRTSKLGTAVSLQLQAVHPLSEALTFAATGLPAGLTMSASGLVTGTPTQAGFTIATVTVTDVSSNVVTTKITWLVTGSSGCMPSSWVKNGGFESQSNSWTATAGVIGQALGSYNSPHDGDWRAKLGGHNAVHTDTLSQSVPMPSVNCGTANIKYWVWVTTDETTTISQFDKLTVKFGATTAGTLSNLDEQRGYVQKTYSISPAWNASSTLLFTSVEDSSQLTRFVVDDVSVEIP